MALMVSGDQSVELIWMFLSLRPISSICGDILDCRLEIDMRIVNYARLQPTASFTVDLSLYDYSDYIGDSEVPDYGNLLLFPDGDSDSE